MWLQCFSHPLVVSLCTGTHSVRAWRSITAPKCHWFMSQTNRAAVSTSSRIQFSASQCRVRPRQSDPAGARALGEINRRESGEWGVLLNSYRAGCFATPFTRTPVVASPWSVCPEAYAVRESVANGHAAGLRHWECLIIHQHKCLHVAFRMLCVWAECQHGSDWHGNGFIDHGYLNHTSAVQNQSLYVCWKGEKHQTTSLVWLLLLIMMSQVCYLVDKLLTYAVYFVSSVPWER